MKVIVLVLLFLVCLQERVLADSTSYRIVARANFSRGSTHRTEDFSYFVKTNALRTEWKEQYIEHDLGHTCSHVMLLLGARPSRECFIWGDAWGGGAKTAKKNSALCFGGGTKREKNPTISREPKNTKKNIANYECSIFQRIVKNDQETACVSERFERELRPVLKMLKYGRSSEVLFHVPKLGLVLEYQSIVSNDINTGQQESRYSFALSEVQKETFEKSLFQIPKGYKVKTETPNDSVILGAPWDPPEIQVPHKLGN